MSIDTSKLWMISVQDDEDVKWIRSPFNDELSMRGFSLRYLNDKRYSKCEVFTEHTLDIELDIVVEKDPIKFETVTLRQILFGHRYQDISETYKESEEFRKRVHDSHYE